MKKRLTGIALHSIHSSGRAVGYCGTSRVYVDGGLPGETVDLEIDRVQRGYRYGKVVNVSNSSPQRVRPFCKHYSECGGCEWQHFSYEAQLHWKREILVNALAKYEIVTPPVPKVIPSPLLQGYRNKSEYTFAAPDILGFHSAERRDTVCAIDECYLQPTEVQQTAVAIKTIALELELPFYDYPTRTGLLRSVQIRTTTTGQLVVLVECTTNDTRIVPFINRLIERLPKVSSWFYSIDRGEPMFVSGEQYLTEYSGNLQFRYSPAAFYQPNPLQAQNLCRLVNKFAGTGNGLIYDLYTGIGSLACHVAQSATTVIGIEGNAQAIADAQYNAAANGIINTKFLVGDILHTFNNDFVAQYRQPDVIILDPPRFGTLIEIKKTIVRAAPRKIVYVSCNPVSLAFDLKQLCEHYRVTAIQPVDMFPHTHHIETVVLLER